MHGSIMISQPVFFARHDWVADHDDWRPRIQMCKTIDVSRGDGQRILVECLERTARLRPEAEPLADELPRYGVPQTVQPRLGQGAFRIAVTSAYGACAVSSEHSLPAFEAAHVRPYADGGEHALHNGLLLRADIHRLFDMGYVTVTPDHVFRVSERLMDDFHIERAKRHVQGSTSTPWWLVRHRAFPQTHSRRPPWFIVRRATRLLDRRHEVQ